MNDILAHALAYADLGFQIILLHGISEGACTCQNVSCNSPGKHPATRNGLKDATYDKAIITTWFSSSLPRNIGIRTGKESGIFVVDIDSDEAEKKLQSYFGQLPATMETTTGKGRHLFFKYPGRPVKSFTGVLGKNSKIDCRGDGGYVVAGGSTHFSGKKYEAIMRSVAEAPGALLELVCKVDRAATDPRPVPDTSSNKDQRQEMPDDEIRDMLSYLDPDMEYDEWVKVGMALHAGGYSVDLWDQWSKGSKKYQPDECHYKWKTFTTRLS